MNRRNLFVLYCVIMVASNVAYADPLTVMVDGYCYLERNTEYSATKVKFIADPATPQAQTDSAYTDILGHFNIANLASGLYDVEYIHANYEMLTVVDQWITGNLTLPTVTLYLPRLSGALSGALGPGEYIINSDISLAAGDSLRLMPGTIFRFEPPYLFSVYGTLHAQGTADDSIVFMRQSDSAWGRLEFLQAGSSGSILEYCCIEGGSANGRGFYTYRTWGGGLITYQASPRFSHCLITNNSAPGSGGGVLCRGGTPLFSECEFSYNQAHYGGGLALHPGTAQFVNCLITNNTGNHWGGGVYAAASRSLFNGCAIRNNSIPLGSSGACGGGVFLDGDTSQFENCVISNNLAGEAGGGISCLSSNGTFTNCVIAGNVTSRGDVALWSHGSSIFTHCTVIKNPNYSWGGCAVWFEYLDATSTPALNSCVIVSNEAGIWGPCSLASIEYCCILGGASGPAGIGILADTNANGDSCDVFKNIFYDPLFTDLSAGDYRLQDFSRCIGAGDPIDPPPLDLNGNLRPNPIGSNPDIGAYESLRGQPQPIVMHLMSPNGGETWLQNHPYDIVWTNDGVISHVRIDVYKGGLPHGSFIRRIADGTPNTGSYEWTIWPSLEPAADYYIHVADARNPASDYSDESFTIEASVPPIPENVIIMSNDDGVTLHWRRLSGEDIEYRIYSDSSATGPFSHLAAITSDTFFTELSDRASLNRRFYVVHSASSYVAPWHCVPDQTVFMILCHPPCVSPHWTGCVHLRADVITTLVVMAYNPSLIPDFGFISGCPADPYCAPLNPATIIFNPNAWTYDPVNLVFRNTVTTSDTAGCCVTINANWPTDLR